MAVGQALKIGSSLQFEAHADHVAELVRQELYARYKGDAYTQGFNAYPPSTRPDRTPPTTRSGAMCWPTTSAMVTGGLRGFRRPAGRGERAGRSHRPYPGQAPEQRQPDLGRRHRRSPPRGPCREPPPATRWKSGRRTAALPPGPAAQRRLEPQHPGRLGHSRQPGRQGPLGDQPDARSRCRLSSR